MKQMLTNRILTGLPDAEFSRLMPLLEPVSLSAGERLDRAGDPSRFVYFPENSVLSCHADMSDGKSAEVALIGRDGVAGVPTLFGARPAAHSLGATVAGSALRMRRDELEQELRRGEELRRALQQYAGDYIAQVSQRSACAVLHRLEQRLAVWLLMLGDRVGNDTIEITQERIAQHLGVRRAGVTVVVGQLQDRGALRHGRGRLRLVSRETLEAVACECYGALALAPAVHPHLNPAR
jgi:CRP-like cAMP-binding protein